MWTGQVNDVVLAEVPALPVGRALDVGCGEGADAVWLARNGWTVTALEVSKIALDRGKRAAVAQDINITWELADINDWHSPEIRFELVSLQYPAIFKPGDSAINALLGAVAPGGILLIVGHDLSGAARQRALAHGFDPDVMIQPPDLAASLDDDWEVLVDETRPRTRELAPEAPHVNDVVLLARRRV